VTPDPPVIPRRVVVARGVLWFMRIGIVAMLAILAATFYSRYHKSDDQIDLIRYVENDIPALDSVEAPLVFRIRALLDERQRKPDDVRRELADELMPGLVRLRKLAEAPLSAARTPLVKSLAVEYKANVEALIDACRAMLRAIDDPKLDPRVGFAQVRDALRSAAEKNAAWRRHVAEARDDLRLGPRGQKL
jgi:hypothetical protein